MEYELNHYVRCVVAGDSIGTLDGFLFLGRGDDGGHFGLDLWHAVVVSFGGTLLTFFRV